MNAPIIRNTIDETMMGLFSDSPEWLLGLYWNLRGAQDDKERLVVEVTVLDPWLLPEKHGDLGTFEHLITARLRGAGIPLSIEFAYLSHQETRIRHINRNYLA